MGYKRYDIYLGCNDRNLHDEEEILQDANEKISRFFAQYQIGFSITRQLGGYIHLDGTYVIENSLKITSIGNWTDEEAEEMLVALKQKYNQETVLLIIKDVGISYLTDGREHEN